MLPRVLAAGLVLALASSAGSKKQQVSAPSQTENDFVTVSATVIADRAAIKELLGSDLDGHYVLAQVTVTPKPGKEIDVQRDDFLLRTDKDGDKSHPFAPSQIAGRGVLVVSETGGGGGGVMGESPGPVWGGYPGTDGRPRRMGGDGGAIGGGGGDSGTQAAVQSGAKDKESPLMKTLTARILPEKKTEAALSGLLYFPMEKQKLKDLELIYTTPDGKLSLRFK